jgi:hypothetical protein
MIVEQNKNLWDGSKHHFYLDNAKLVHLKGLYNDIQSFKKEKCITV